MSYHAHGDLTSLAPHERLPEILVVPREKTPTGAASDPVQLGTIRKAWVYKGPTWDLRRSFLP